jgi:hypothetical protein
VGDILGLGISHYPAFSANDDQMSFLFQFALADPAVPASVKDPATWPEQMRAAYGNDNGAAAASRHREDMLVGLRRARTALDEFKPDFVIIWGDDQYENFQEDVIPAFTVLAYPTQEVHPWERMSSSIVGKPNYWGEPRDSARTVLGNPEAAKELAAGLLGEDFDVAYSYKPLHFNGLAHAFLNAVLYLDFDRVGFPYPVIPIAVNCYGNRVISYRGSFSHFADAGRPLDPPSPSPKRCFDLGRAVARVCARSPYRVALCASSSWSHAFMVDKTWRMNPDIAGDRTLYNALVRGDLASWRDVPLSQIAESGQQEMLNWFCLMGAMHELERRVVWSDFVETHIFNSDKVTAVFEPWLAASASDERLQPLPSR